MIRKLLRKLIHMRSINILNLHSLGFTKNKEEAVISIYNKLRPDESVTLESAERYIKSNFFNVRKFDLEELQISVE